MAFYPITCTNPGLRHDATRRHPAGEFCKRLREFDLIRANRRMNADPKMVRHIEGFSRREESAVLDYASRLRPPAEKLAKRDRLNTDFPHHVRPPEPD